MAFCDLKPVRVFDEDSGSTFYIGDVFAVYSFGAERPVAYSWDMVRSVTVNRRSMTFCTDSADFKIDNKLFGPQDDYFRALAIIETMQRDYQFPYSHENRLLPLKSLYMEVAAGIDAYSGEGALDEGDTASAFVMMMNLKLVKVLWLLAVLIMLLTLGALHFFLGITRENIVYCIPISFASGGIITLLIYIICHAVARSKFKRIADGDLAVGTELTFVICSFGFAACESCVYDGQDLVPWDAVDYFVEADKIFIFYKDGQAIAYIPKKVFNKKNLGGITDIISLKVEQK